MILISVLQKEISITPREVICDNGVLPFVAMEGLLLGRGISGNQRSSDQNKFLHHRGLFWIPIKQQAMNILKRERERKLSLQKVNI